MHQSIELPRAYYAREFCFESPLELASRALNLAQMRVRHFQIHRCINADRLRGQSTSTLFQQQVLLAVKKQSRIKVFHWRVS
eukprot:1153862-Pelagomonas_calceolata.AAC.2